MKLIEKKNHSRIEDLIEEYAEKKQLTDSTLKNIKIALKPFSLDNQHNVRMVRDLLSGRYKQSTIKTKFGYIRSFFRWLALLKKVDGIIDPTQDFSIKSTAVYRTRTLTDDEELRLLEHISHISDLDVRLIIRLALFTGARISSICLLEKKSFHDGKIYYRNVKCKKAYDYPIPLKDCETINLFKIASSLADKDDKIFTKHSVSSYTAKVDRMLFDLFGRDCNGETISIHSLRHTFATKALRKGVPPEIIARLLDHSSPAITLKVYARHSQQQIEDAIDKIF